MRRRGERGSAMCTMLVLAVVGLIFLGATVQYQMRRAAQRALARSLAVRDAVRAGESALEEAIFLLRHPVRGPELVRPDSLKARIEPEETRRAAAAARGQTGLKIASVELAQMGRTFESDGIAPQGIIEMRVGVAATTGWLVGPAVARTVVRRYRFEIWKVLSETGSEAASRQVRVLPEPLTQWVESI